MCVLVCFSWVCVFKSVHTVYLYAGGGVDGGVGSMSMKC